MRASVYIQWHGTETCMDFDCGDCGMGCHFDGYLSVVVQCSNCKAQWTMPTNLQLSKILHGESPYMPTIMQMGEEEE